MLSKFLLKKRKEKEDKEREERNNSKDSINKTYIMRKLEKEKAKDLINNRFEDPNDYFNIDKNVIIGINKFFYQRKKN